MVNLIFKIEECEITKELVSYQSKNVEYAQIIDRILKEGLGRFDCLKITLNTRKKAFNCSSNFKAMKKAAYNQIGKFLSKNNVLIIQRGIHIYFHALGGVKFKFEDCL